MNPALLFFDLSLWIGPIKWCKLGVCHLPKDDLWTPRGVRKKAIMLCPQIAKVTTGKLNRRPSVWRPFASFRLCTNHSSQQQVCTVLAVTVAVSNQCLKPGQWSLGLINCWEGRFEIKHFKVATYTSPRKWRYIVRRRTQICIKWAYVNKCILRK